MFDIFTLGPEIVHWIDDAIVILTVVSGIIGKIFYSKNKAAKELTKVINDSPLENKDFLKIAEKAGLKGAVGLLSKLIK